MLRRATFIACLTLAIGCSSVQTSSTTVPSASSAVAPPASTVGSDTGTPVPSTDATTMQTPAERAASICTTAALQSREPITNPDVTEASGLIKTRTHDDLFITHNDSGDAARIYGIGADGTERGTWRLTDKRGIPLIALDIEDIAVGPGPAADTSYIFVADIGDNLEIRPRLLVHRFAESELRSDRDAIAVDTFLLAYPDRAVDAEAFAVDPLTGSWTVITKGWDDGISRIFQTPMPLQPRVAATVDLEPAGELDLRSYGRLATGADVSPDGTVVGIRTLRSILLFARPTGAPLADAFNEQPCEAATADEPQGESLAMFDTGYATVSEGSGQPLYIFAATPG